MKNARGDAVSAPVDLAKLADDAMRWPSGWTPNIVDGEWCGSFDCKYRGSPNEIETGPDTDYSVDLGQFLADAVNAIPAIAALTAERDSLRAHVEALRDAHSKHGMISSEGTDALRALYASAKVSL